MYDFVFQFQHWQHLFIFLFLGVNQIDVVNRCSSPLNQRGAVETARISTAGQPFTDPSLRLLTCQAVLLCVNEARK